MLDGGKPKFSHAGQHDRHPQIGDEEYSLCLEAVPFDLFLAIQSLGN